VLELREKIAGGVELGAVVGTDDVAARDALVELGWTVVEAERVLAGVDPELAPEERVREALRNAA